MRRGVSFSVPPGVGEASSSDAGGIPRSSSTLQRKQSVRVIAKDQAEEQRKFQKALAENKAFLTEMQEAELLQEAEIAAKHGVLEDETEVRARILKLIESTERNSSRADTLLREVNRSFGDHGLVALDEDDMEMEDDDVQSSMKDDVLKKAVQAVDNHKEKVAKISELYKELSVEQSSFNPAKFKELQELLSESVKRAETLESDLETVSNKLRETEKQSWSVNQKMMISRKIKSGAKAAIDHEMHEKEKSELTENMRQRSLELLFPYMKESYARLLRKEKMLQQLEIRERERYDADAYELEQKSVIQISQQSAHIEPMQPQKQVRLAQEHAHQQEEPEIITGEKAEEASEMIVDKSEDEEKSNNTNKEIVGDVSSHAASLLENGDRTPEAVEEPESAFASESGIAALSSFNFDPSSPSIGAAPLGMDSMDEPTSNGEDEAEPKKKPKAKKKTAASKKTAAAKPPPPAAPAPAPAPSPAKKPTVPTPASSKWGQAVSLVKSKTSAAPAKAAAAAVPPPPAAPLKPKPEQKDVGVTALLEDFVVPKSATPKPKSVPASAVSRVASGLASASSVAVSVTPDMYSNSFLTEIQEAEVVVTPAIVDHAPDLISEIERQKEEIERQREELEKQREEIERLRYELDAKAHVEETNAVLKELKSALEENKVELEERVEQMRDALQEMDADRISIYRQMEAYHSEAQEMHRRLREADQARMVAVEELGDMRNQLEELMDAGDSAESVFQKRIYSLEKALMRLRDSGKVVTERARQSSDRLREAYGIELSLGFADNSYISNQHALEKQAEAQSEKQFGLATSFFPSLETVVSSLICRPQVAHVATNTVESGQSERPKDGSEDARLILYLSKENADLQDQHNTTAAELKALRESHNELMLSSQAALEEALNRSRPASHPHVAILETQIESLDKEARKLRFKRWSESVRFENIKKKMDKEGSSGWDPAVLDARHKKSMERVERRRQQIQKEKEALAKQIYHLVSAPSTPAGAVRLPPPSAIAGFAQSLQRSMMNMNNNAGSGASFNGPSSYGNNGNLAHGTSWHQLPAHNPMNFQSSFKPAAPVGRQPFGPSSSMMYPSSYMPMLSSPSSSFIPSSFSHNSSFMSSYPSSHSMLSSPAMMSSPPPPLPAPQHISMLLASMPPLKSMPPAASGFASSRPIVEPLSQHLFHGYTGLGQSPNAPPLPPGIAAANAALLSESSAVFKKPAAIPIGPSPERRRPVHEPPPFSATVESNALGSLNISASHSMAPSLPLSQPVQAATPLIGSSSSIPPASPLSRSNSNTAVGNPPENLLVSPTLSRAPLPGIPRTTPLTSPKRPASAQAPSSFMSPVREQDPTAAVLVSPWVDEKHPSTPLQLPKPDMHQQQSSAVDEPKSNASLDAPSSSSSSVLLPPAPRFSSGNSVAGFKNTFALYIEQKRVKN